MFYIIKEWFWRWRHKSKFMSETELIAALRKQGYHIFD